MLFLFAWLTDVAIDASEMAFFIDLLVEWFKFLFACGHALRIVAFVLTVNIAFASEDIFLNRILLRDIKKEEDESHSHVLAIQALLEVAGSWVIVDFDADLIDAWKRMHDDHVFLRSLKLIDCEDVVVLKSFVFRKVIESLSLDAGHIKDIKGRHSLFKRSGFDILHVVWLKDVFFDIVRKLELLWRYEDDFDVLVAA